MACASQPGSGRHRTNGGSTDEFFPRPCGGSETDPKKKRRLLPRFRFHDLRHSAATLLLVQGVHPKTVQELLGHDRIGTTMDVYSHVIDVVRAEAADKMDQLFLPASEPVAQAPTGKRVN